MHRLTWLALLFLGFTSSAALGQEAPKTIATGVQGATAIAVGQGGKVYVALNEKGAKAGKVVVMEKDKFVPFATTDAEVRGMTAYLDGLIVVGKDQLWKIDAKGKAEVLFDAKAFPTPPVSLQDVAVDIKGELAYVSDSGDKDGKGGAIYKVNLKDKKISVVVDSSKSPLLHNPHLLLLDGAARLLSAEGKTLGDLLYVNTASGATEIFNHLGDLKGVKAIAWDYHGRLYVSIESPAADRILVNPRPEMNGDFIGLAMVGHNSFFCVDATGKNLLVVDSEKGTLSQIPAQVPGQKVDDTPIALEGKAVFTNVKWAGWAPEDDKGIQTPFRPLVLTHAGDGSNRIFVATQQGTVHVMPNDQKATASKVFLDLTSRVFTDLKTENEQGFLGLAFHPKFKENGQFFVFYTLKENKKINVLSRFKVSKDDANKADPASEEVLLKIERSNWNRDGGTVLFGKDGMLYLVTGDGGPMGAPLAQKLDNLLGKVIRIDVDHHDMGKNYAIPKDNPFVGQKDALGEIWAYGIRNSWRLSMDSKTGKIWSGENGQELYEEIDIIEKGGNYGWNKRESMHPYGPAAVGPNKDMTEPIWEYSHELGKSLIGGSVYHGKRLPELEGMYVYGDYISGKLWALHYDETAKRVDANHDLKKSPVTLFSWGEDEQGEIYYLTESPTGQSIYWLERTK